MICKLCGGSCEWMGKLANLTHTRCRQCGAINSYVTEEEEDDWTTNG